MKSTKPKLNVRLLRKVKKHILNEPRRLNMGHLAAKSNNAPCGTTACIAGWALLLSKQIPFTLSDSPENKADVYVAESLLGLPRNEGGALFWTWNWPLEYRNRYRDAISKAEEAKVAAERIDHFIATRE